MTLSERYRAVAETTVYVIDAVGVLVIILGMLIAARGALGTWRTATAEAAYQKFRITLGRAILLALEFFIVGDIIRTVLVSHAVSTVTVLALIVLIRTFLAVALEVEIEGRWPWQQARVSKE